MIGVSPPLNVWLQLVHATDGAVSEAPGQQIAGPQPASLLNNGAPTQVAAADPMAHSVCGGEGTNQVGTVVLTPPEVPETAPMKIALIPASSSLRN